MVKDSGATVRADRLRPLNTPRPMRVETDERGRPMAVYLIGRRRKDDAETRRTEESAAHIAASPAPRAVRSHLPIETILDRWRIDDEWWRREISRMYFSVALEGGQLLTLFHDLTTGRWYGQTSATPMDSLWEKGEARAQTPSRSGRT
jgi:hypothetical protein